MWTRPGGSGFLKSDPRSQLAVRALPDYGGMTTCSEGEIRYTFHMSVKEQVLQAIQCLPDDINFRDVTDEIALLAAIQDAERDVEDGRLISNDEMKSRISQWSAIGRVWPASMGEADLDNSPLVSGDMRGQFQPIQSNFDDLRGRLIKRRSTKGVAFPAEAR